MIGWVILAGARGPALLFMIFSNYVRWCFLESIKAWARRVKRDVLTVYYAARDPRTPLFVRALALMLAAYALSPIDLIPDFIPLLGYLDDLLLVPLGLIIVIRLLPAHVLESSRAKAATASERPCSRTAAIIIVFIWLVFAGGLAYFVLAQTTGPGSKGSGLLRTQNIVPTANAATQYKV